eukprot:TRINITY_DN26804_c0_g1_i1.p1 TRINITY_DN26804_c0_g1~~TRINITY_DN26804_c0_g1_i1.p1  ORF type:complete len:310 (+),score=78.60 TRINITY_DN26804_c0_g1_i1:47-931(+)
MSNLSAAYSKWDSIECSDDEGPTTTTTGLRRTNVTESSLDALKGSEEEVRQIRKNWGYHDAVEEPVQEKKEKITTNTKPATTTRTFKEWDSFDADKELLNLENEDMHDPEEAPSMVSGTKEVINVDCVNYKKDREEYDLDRELEDRGKDLKQRTAYRFNTSHTLKEDGNKALKKGNLKEAIKIYLSAQTCVASCISAIPVMSPSMGQKVKDLATTIASNLSQAFVSSNQYSEALAAAEEALSLTPSHEKSLYRKAVCCRQLGRYKDALEALTALPRGNSAGAKLRVEIEGMCSA